MLQNEYLVAIVAVHTAENEALKIRGDFIHFFNRLLGAHQERPRAVVFDLDGCLWYPDMYLLWGGGPPFTAEPDGSLVDSKGQRVRLLGAVLRC